MRRLAFQSVFCLWSRFSHWLPHPCHVTLVAKKEDSLSRLQQLIKACTKDTHDSHCSSGNFASALPSTRNQYSAAISENYPLTMEI